MKSRENRRDKSKHIPGVPFVTKARSGKEKKEHEEHTSNTPASHMLLQAQHYRDGYSESNNKGPNTSTKNLYPDEETQSTLPQQPSLIQTQYTNNHGPAGQGDPSVHSETGWASGMGVASKASGHLTSCLLHSQHAQQTS